MKHARLLLISLLCLCLLTGCGGGGGGGGSPVTFPTSNTTISGQLSVPTVNAAGLLAAVSYTNDDDLLKAIASSAVCTVNGKAVAFNLVTATRYFSIPDLETASVYDVKFAFKSIEFRLITPHTSSSIYESINLDTTAEAMLIEKYQLSSQLATVEINQDWRDYLAGQLLARMQDASTTPDAFQSFFTTELASFSANVPVTSLTTSLTPAVNLTGTWKTAIPMTYYTFNIYGEKTHEVTANAILTITQSGNSLSGILDLDVSSYKHLGPEIGYVPVDEHMTMSGTISSTLITLAGRNTTAKMTATSSLMRGALSNTDLNTFFGVETVENGINLIKQ